MEPGTFCNRKALALVALLRPLAKWKCQQRDSGQGCQGHKDDKVTSSHSPFTQEESLGILASDAGLIDKVSDKAELQYSVGMTKVHPTIAHLDRNYHQQPWHLMQFSWKGRFQKRLTV